MSEDILFERRGALGLVTLNRPKALNALTQDMLRRLHARLEAWAEDEAVACVAIQGAGERAFCAGGDIRALYEKGVARGRENWSFYWDEYRLNAFIRRFPKPYVAFMDGIVMGGGVGVSIHGSHRVAMDGARFAMPETGIGLFPDVGATCFLPRLPGETGMWVALTGARLDASDCVVGGVCDLRMASADREAALQALAAADYGDSPKATVGARLSRWKISPDPCALYERRSQIDLCFAGDSVEDVLAALEADGSDWARTQREAILSKSPSSTRIAFRQLREGARMGFEDAMRLEYRLARWCMTHPDFYEGVRATVIDKDGAPRWRPATLEEADDAHVADAFAPLPEGEELAL